ncbi:MAG: helicase-related protein [Anaeromyxobacter sp.]
MRRGEKPDLARVMAGLKDFQRRSVEYIVERLYDAPDRVDRFLLADEVGLGKTKVARGVIAHALHRLWEPVERIDVIYVCSNATIARQNVNRLQLGMEDDFSSASRLTLLPLHLRDLSTRKVNFVSFTPGTSFELSSSTGIRHERMLIHRLLSDGWGLRGTGPRNLLQGEVDRARWRRDLAWLEEELRKEGQGIDPALADNYLRALGGEPGLRARFEDLASQCARTKEFPDELRPHRNELIGRLRKILARTCIKELQPDLVILDEFQRFKSLLAGAEAAEEDREAAELAADLFAFQGEAGRAKVLLLSATPYKMFTLSHEAEDHYSDFLATTGFLLESKEEVAALEADLYGYRDALCGAARGAEAVRCKEQVEQRLRRVMSRTERLSAGVDQNGLVAERRTTAGAVTPDDVMGYCRLDEVMRELDGGEPVELWKSAPFLLSVMDEHYKLKSRLRLALRERHPAVWAALERARGTLLDPSQVEQYAPIEGGNARVRALLEATVRNGGWKLLWLPPSLPYYTLAGPWADPGVRDFTKALVFSAWHVVPKAIAMLASYEAERLAVQGGAGEPFVYEELGERIRGTIRITEKDGKLGGLASMSLAYPCATLARAVDPLLARGAAGGELPDAAVSLDRARALLQEVLRPEIEAAAVRGGPVDEDWYWAAPLLLDLRRTPAAIRWLMEPDPKLAWQAVVGEGEGEDSLFRKGIARLREFARQPWDLGRPPPDLADVVASMALGSPAVALLRALGRQWPQQADAPALLAAAAIGAMGFWRMYNRPESVLVLRAWDAREPHWNRALDYGVAGNLQAVLDEYVHALRDHLGLTEQGASAALDMGRKVGDTASLAAVRLSYDVFASMPDGPEKAGPQVKHLRARYALRFGQGRDPSDDAGGQDTRDGQVRDAFNSPFRPFVLASTSVGQEGLDFHLYCHAIYHWNLPGNPVDLEQREGRIHRFKGHVVRRNVANANRARFDGGDPWATLFEDAASGSERRSELVPYWVFPGPYRIERHVPLLPLSRDRQRFDDLRRSMALYRLAFGQPRQEDLLRVLSAETLPAAEQGDWQIDLAPRERRGDAPAPGMSGVRSGEALRRAPD